VHGGSTAGHLKALGAKRVLFSMDSLTTGPASPEPVTHSKLRQTYWRDFYRRLPRPAGRRALRSSSPRGELTSATDLKVALRGRRSDQPVVLWTGDPGDEVLFAWWACDALLRCRVSPRDVWVASASAELDRGSTSELKSVAWASDEAVRRVFSVSRRSTAAFLRAGARRWAAFAAGELGALQRPLSPRGQPALRLSPLPRAAAELIPQVRRRGGGRQLHLSDYDERLLGVFSSGAWSTARARFGDPSTRAAFRSLLDDHGGLLIASRLAAWAAHAPDVLEQRPASAASSFLDAVEYKLTGRGMDLIKNGLTALALAPQMSVGGFVAYAAQMKWGCEFQGEDWRFVRLSAAALMAPSDRSRLRSTAELVAATLVGEDDDDGAWEAIWALQERGDTSVFEAATALLGSASEKERGRGVDLLAQLGTPNPSPALSASCADAIVGALAVETSPSVLHSMGVALGHLRDARAVAALIPFTRHPAPKVRLGVALGLAPHPAPESVAALVTLSADSDDDVRDWATFALGQMADVDTPALRDALVRRLDDANPEARGEALAGLAQRQDARVLEPLRRELGRRPVGLLAVEAAGSLGDSTLRPLLLKLRRELQRTSATTEEHFRATLDEAIAALVEPRRASE
jgi:HEAT repeat protein